MNKEQLLNTQPENLAGQAGLNKLFRFNHLYFAGYQTEESFLKLKELGIKRVIDLKNPGEVPFDDQDLANKCGLEYHNFPVNGAESLPKDRTTKINELVQDTNTPTLIYCMSGNRVGMWFASHLMLDHDFSIDQAVQKAQEAGMDKPPLADATKSLLASY